LSAPVNKGGKASAPPLSKYEVSEIAYHLLELEIARAADDPRRVMPVLSNRDGSILDIGCGAGQTLIACDLKPGVFACGVDVDEEALVLGKLMSRDFPFNPDKCESFQMACAPRAEAGKQQCVAFAVSPYPKN
jgi:SAM-dependent methyltransferase